MKIYRLELAYANHKKEEHFETYQQATKRVKEMEAAIEVLGLDAVLVSWFVREIDVKAFKSKESGGEDYAVSL